MRYVTFLFLIALCGSATATEVDDRKALLSDPTWPAVEARVREEVAKREGPDWAKGAGSGFSPVARKDNTWIVVASAPYPLNTMGNNIDIEITTDGQIVRYSRRWEKPQPPPSLQDAVAAYNRADFKTTIEAAKTHADGGDLTAQYILGSAYANAKELRNLVEAETWLRRCADKGVVPAMRDLGHLNLLYKGDESTWDEAIDWYTKAASRGDHEAQQVLGVLNVRAIESPADAYMWLTLAATTTDKDSRTLSNALMNELRKSLPSQQIEEATKKASRFRTSAAGTVRVTGLRFEATTKQHMASTQQLKFGRLVGDILGLDAVFGALFYPPGGLIGKGSY